MKLNVLILMLFSSVSWAQLQSPYSFGGACPSQGTWTQSVLSQAQVISGVIESLKKDENCNAVSKSLNNYYSEIKGNPNLNSNQGNSNLTELGGQILSLAGVLGGVPIQQTAISNALAEKTVALQAQSAPLALRANDGGMSTLSLRQRTFNTVNSGLDSLIRMTDAIQGSQQCLLNHGSELGQLMSGAVYTLSAFVAGGDNASGARLAQAISSIATVLRNGKYNSILAKLNQERYNNSIRCLMEITSDSYCTVRDNLELMQLNVKSLNIKMKDQADLAPDTDSPKTPLNVRQIVTNPFSGLYLLSNHIPNLNRYFQKILTGTDPNDKYEAQKQNDIEKDRSGFTIARNGLRGDFNRGRQDVLNQTDISAQRNEVVKLIGILRAGLAVGGSKNFFEVVSQASEIPFMLIGIPKENYPCQVFNPSVCADPAQRQMGLTFDAWLNLGIIKPEGEHGFLADPKTLIDKIGVNLDSILSQADSAFNVYYGTWFLPDKTSIIEQAVIGRPSVYDSLLVTSRYLENFEKRAKALSYGRAPVNLSIDTRRRVNAALRSIYAYKQKKSDVDGDELRQMADKTILDLYRLFNLQQSRTTLLTDRLHKIVQSDYRMMLESGLDFSDYQKKMLMVLGENVANEMISLVGKPWQQVQSDLLNASFLAKKNIEAMEEVFKDQMIQSIAETSLTARNLRPTRATVAWDSRERLANDSSWIQVNGDESFLRRYVKTALREASPHTTIWKLYNSYWHGDRYRYSRFSLRSESSSPDSTFGAAKYITAQMCIQSLAFNGWADFKQVCKGAVLPSIFEGLAEVKIDATEGDALNASYDKISVKDASNASLNHDNRICAFRDYYRNNYIFQLAAGLQSSGNSTSQAKSGTNPNGNLEAPPAD